MAYYQGKGPKRDEPTGTDRSNYEEIIKLQREVADIKRRCCCGGGGGVGLTDLNPPVDAPGNGDPIFLFNPTEGIEFYWDGAVWQIKTRKDQMVLVVDGGDSTLTTGTKAFVRIPFKCTVTGWTILETSDTPIATTTVVSVWKDVYANYPPDGLDAISGTEKPSLSNAIQNQDLSLDTWLDVVLEEDDIVGFTIESNDLAKRIAVFLHTAVIN